LPFDNLIWYRERTAELFKFKNEMYTPFRERDRIYGYYVMPILHNGALIGRIEPKVDRKARRLTLRNSVVEPVVEINDRTAVAVCRCIRGPMEFTGCRSVMMNKTSRKGLSRAISTAR